MICPRCGAEVPDGPECAACGVVVRKYLARQKGEVSSNTRNESLSQQKTLPFQKDTGIIPGRGPVKAPVETARKLSDRKMAGAYGQLGRMLEAGLSPTEALYLISRSARGKLATAADAMRSDIQQGASFAQAAANQPVLFPESSIAIIQAGESTGGLPAALDALASSARVRLDIKRQIIRASIYPFVLFTLVFFIPKAYLLFTVGFWAYLMACLIPYLTGLGILIALVWFVPMLASKLMGRELTGRVLRSIPGLKGLFKLSSKARFMGHLGAGLSSGLPIVSCLRLAGSATSDPAWIAGMSRAENMVKNGSSLHDALASTGLLDDEMLLCVSSGERVGRLEESLEQEASLLDSTFLHRLNISIQILSVCILLATYAFVASAVVGEYEDVMDGAKTQLDQVLKEVGGGHGGDMSKLLKGLGGANGGDLSKLLKGLDGGARGNDLERLLKGLDGAQGNDLEKLLKEMNRSSGSARIPSDLKGTVK